MRSLFDLNHPFFRPLWVRVAITCIAAGWGIFETIQGNYFWGAVFGLFAAFSVWGFFIDFRPRHPR